MRSHRMASPVWEARAEVVEAQVEAAKLIAIATEEEAQAAEAEAVAVEAAFEAQAGGRRSGFSFGMRP